MKAPQELRLGNYVEYRGYFYQVWSIGNNSNPRRESYFIDLDSSTIDNHLKGVDSNDISAIELTEDWLLKFGFLIDYMNKDILICAYYGNNPVTKDYILELKNVGDGWFYRNGYFKMKYVHQLQNLYFALTGEELKIKES
ncbi:hypothetical protein ACR1PO_15640 [Chryseobacterium sp. RRHN12]|uniref:hypothetical protein n=1 Tax=Chryseobacterium sp. RRHN12 TaxID=3437884 RepID=UPI003D9B1A5F